MRPWTLLLALVAAALPGPAVQAEDLSAAGSAGSSIVGGGGGGQRNVSFACREPRTAMHPHIVKVPDIGDFQQVLVIEVMVKPGDTVANEQSLVTVESDKATMEIPSSAAGVVDAVLVKIGDRISEGTPLVRMRTDAVEAPSSVGVSHIHRRSGTGPSIFISYRREDSQDICGRIHDRLVLHFGQESVFKDVDSIPIGFDFRKHLTQAVTQCSVLLAVIGRNWLTARDEHGQRRIDNPRDFLRIEIEAALQRDIPVIPVLVQGAAIPSERDLPPTLESLAFRHGAVVRPDPDFHNDLQRIVRGIEQHVAGRPG